MPVTYRQARTDLDETARRHAERSGRPLWETWLLEPGLHALAWHRAARYCLERGWVFRARLCGYLGARLSGSEISPAARIGKRCMIVQGSGVVIGPSAVLGDDCTLEPGVMLLGAGLALPTGATLDAYDSKRTHPSLGNHVLVEAGAVLAGDVFIGNDVRIFAGAVVTRDVPDGGVAIGVPGRVLLRAQARPDPDARAVQALAERVYHLEEQLQILAFAAQRLQGGGLPRSRPSDQYGPIAAVEELIDGAGI